MNTSFRLSAIIILIFLCSTTLFAQHYSLADFDKVDSIAQRAKPKDALSLIEKIADQAKQNSDSPLLIKSVIYRMMFQSYLEEDAFDKVLEGLRGDIYVAKQPEKSILQSLLAETYWNYFLQNSWKIRQRTVVSNDTNNDIKTWSIAKLTDEIIKYYLFSVQDSDLLQKTKVDLLKDVLTGDEQ